MATLAARKIAYGLSLAMFVKPSKNERNHKVISIVLNMAEKGSTYGRRHKAEDGTCTDDLCTA